MCASFFVTVPRPRPFASYANDFGISEERERERERNKLFKHGAKEGAAALKAAPGAQLDFWNFLSVYQYYKKSDVHVGLAIIQHIGNFTPREI
jgi:hypothetical protein